ALADDGFNWKQAEGQTVRVLLDSHPWQEAIEKRIPEFEALTGIKVEVSSLAEATYWDRVTLGLSSDNPPFDVFMLSPNQTGYTGYQNSWIEPLDNYLQDTKKTNSAYDFEDIYKYTVNGFRLPSEEGKAYGIPISLETYMLFYRTDLFAEQKIDVPALKTVNDWLGALTKIDAAYKEKGIAAVSIRGQDPTMPDELLAAVYNYWGDRPFMAQRMFYFDDNWRPQFTDAAVVKGFELWAKLLNFGPPGVENFTWYEVSNSFAQGRTATIWFDASVFAGVLNDPKQSSVVGKIGYAAVPKTETGHGTTHWGWGLGMTAKSPVKDAAWLFIQWATSKESDLDTGKATFGPVRASSWKALAGTFPPEFTKAADESFKISVPGYMYFDGAREIADRIIDAVIRLKGGEDAKTVMGELNDQAAKIVEANHLQK
ncbi:MAG: sugar ABC transporter substrate-binding protein, partial [Hyphomicrobiales bacterium]|nr:sugar ABC transporter substrate-binding protein [Hyphomicrobiales bacterium]